MYNVHMCCLVSKLSPGLLDDEVFSTVATGFVGPLASECAKEVVASKGRHAYSVQELGHYWPC